MKSTRLSVGKRWFDPSVMTRELDIYAVHEP